MINRRYPLAFSAIALLSALQSVNLLVARLIVGGTL
jgi:hypothetical protein